MRREYPLLTCDEEVHTLVYDPDRAEPVCSKCGLVLDEMRLDFAMESTAVPRTRAFCPRPHTDSKRLSRRQSIERNLRGAFSKKSVQRVVQDKTLELCEVVCRKQLHRGYAVSTISSALVYAAHRVCRVPVTLAECASASSAERRRVAHCYKNLCGKIELNVPRFESVGYLYLLVQKRRIDNKTVVLACWILEKVKEKRLVGGATPIGIAAAALYIAGSITGNRITQKELAKIASVSEVTIRVNCKIFSKLLQTGLHGERRV